MRGTQLSALLQRCGLQLRPAPAQRDAVTTPADFERLFPGDGRGALRPGLARLDGVVQHGRARAPGCRACTWRAAACTRGRACRWRRCRAGWRRRACSTDLASTTPVAPGGYAWWYVDALSDDGRHGLTLIAFIGSVFSPYYAWARRRRRPRAADPLHHCALNVALYGDGGKRWAMTERGRASVLRERVHAGHRPEPLRWDGGRAHHPHRRGDRAPAVARARAWSACTRWPR